MNSIEAKKILQLYRRHAAEAQDPQIAEALALAGRDPELAEWLEQHCARQLAIATQFRQIPVPAGLKEQIISEHAANRRSLFRHRKVEIALLVVILIFGSVAGFQLVHRDAGNVAAAADNTMPVYRQQMTGVVLRGYGMDLLTNNPVAIRAYLAENKALADFILPAALQTVDLAGCSVQGWQKGKVSMICFRTGKSLSPGQASDLWLFVTDRAAIKDAPAPGKFQFATVNQLITVAWTQGEKTYLLEIEGDEATLRKLVDPGV